MADKPSKSILQYLGIGALIGGGLYFAYSWFFQKFYITPGRPRFSLGTSITNEIELRLTLPLTVSNNTGIAVPITSFFGTLTYGSTNLGYVTWYPQTPTVIAARGNTTIEPVVRIPIAQTAGNIIQLITSGQFLGVLNVSGGLATPDFLIPIDQNIRLA